MSHLIVIFGASGDLTKRKLIPALYALFRKNRLPDDTRIIGVSRTAFSHDEWRAKLAASTDEFVDDFDSDLWQQFARSIYYQPGDIAQADDFRQLDQFLSELECGSDCTRVYYLSTAPSLYTSAVKQLDEMHRTDTNHSLKGNDRVRIVVEKPFGTDLTTAQSLNSELHEVFDEQQIFRIDHYLGKETVQNMMVLRFANSIFEPIWNRNYIDHVQITVAEEVAVGSRAGYYDESGVLRDMFQNHLLQLLMITAMESPARFDANLVRDEKVKVLRAIRPMTAEQIRADTFRGQYESYLDEPGVAADSSTATFAALCMKVDNWRWNGVPFFLRSGKAMSCRTTQIVIQFHDPPQLLFSKGTKADWDANRLLIQIQPAEGIQLQFQTKVPDSGMKTRMTDLNFSFGEQFNSKMPDAYQRLLLDALNGDASLFARSDEVETAWSIIDPIMDAWDGEGGPPLFTYPLGHWGPDESREWMEQHGQRWFDVCPVL